MFAPGELTARLIGERQGPVGWLVFNNPERRVSATKNLVDTLGPAHTREMLITARQYEVAEALAIGLVQRVVPVAVLEDHVLETCAGIAANAPRTMRAAKRIVRELLASPASFDEAACKGFARERFESEDYREGRRAFMEKRAPAFKGR